MHNLDNPLLGIDEMHDDRVGPPVRGGRSRNLIQWFLGQLSIRNIRDIESSEAGIKVGFFLNISAHDSQGIKILCVFSYR